VTRRILAVLATAAVLALAGCGPDDHRGDPGKVVDREESFYTTRVGKTTTQHWDYDLTIRRPDGSTYELDVSEDAYDRCYRGSSYPKCVDR
jgi:hypothetical protein